MTPSYNLILPGLYLGDYASANNPLLLAELGVRAIVSLDVDPPSTALPHLVVQILDKEDEDLLSKFPNIIDFISRERNATGSVLVHCFHGVSRSASAVIAYLMHTQKLSLPLALSFVRRIRPSIEPNEGFMKQLELFSLMSCSLQANHHQYRLFKFLIGDPIATDGLKKEEFKCRKCGFRHRLNVFPHRPSQNLADWSSTPEKSSFSPCMKGTFIEPANSTMGVECDKIKCSGCMCKLGRFSIDHEISCPCGTTLPHGFWINLSLVDAIRSLDLSVLR